MSKHICTESKSISRTESPLLLGREKRNIPKFGRENRNISKFGRESQNMPKFGPESRNMPKVDPGGRKMPIFGQESRNINQVTRPGLRCWYWQQADTGFSGNFWHFLIVDLVIQQLSIFLQTSCNGYAPVRGSVSSFGRICDCKFPVLTHGLHEW